ncbi:MAG TPA: type IV pilus modification protein PilV [Gammaproteobacteria bacterium]|jgi:type IV pilus assembly protein PilV
MSAEHRAYLPRAALSGCRGVTLVEVMVSLVILSVGLLGLAGLQTRSLQFNTSAYYRTQATALAYSLADRTRANRQGALNNLYNGVFENPAPACDPNAGGGGTPAQDVAAWRNMLACQLPEGTGSVARNGAEFTITVQWDDSRGEEPPEEFAFTTAL